MLTKSLLLLSDKGSVTDSIVALITPMFSTNKIIFQSTTIEESIQNHHSDLINSDVVLVNLSQISTNSGQIVQNLINVLGDIPLIVLHHYQQKVFAEAFIDMGARAYLPIDIQLEELTTAIEQIFLKKTYISKRVY